MDSTNICLTSVKNFLLRFQFLSTKYTRENTYKLECLKQNTSVYTCLLWIETEISTVKLLQNLLGKDLQYFPDIIKKKVRLFVNFVFAVTTSDIRKKWK